MAQGTIRPLSERAFFISFYALFGLNALPFRLMVFFTQFVNLALVASLTRRLTRSRAAGLLAALLWTANSSLGLAMSWTSAYNQILCAFFLLLSFHLLVRYTETGKRSYFIWQWVTFLLGFGALEINVVYPVVAASYTLCCARRYFRKTLWLFIPSAIFVAVHQHVVPKPASDLYLLHFDAGILSTLWTYWEWALGPARLGLISVNLAPWIAPAATVFLTVAVVVFCVWKLRKREWLAGFLVIWFLVVITPVLPLREHVSDYYLTVPVIGLAMLGAWAATCAWKAHTAGKIVAILAVTIYLGSSIPFARVVTRFRYERSQEVRTLVRGLAEVHELHPGKVILLSGVDTGLFWGGVFDRSYRLLGISDLYLTPGSEANIEAHREVGEVSDYVLPAGPALRALEQNRAVVYAAGGERLRNVTGPVRAVARSRWAGAKEPQRVEVGNSLFAGQLGPEWYAVEESYRWMPKRATVRLGGPHSPGQKLHVEGFCSARQIEEGPLAVTVSVDGQAYPPVLLDRGDAAFKFSFPLPSELVGKERIEVSVEVDRTFTVASDPRPLGLVFGTFAVR
jgi:hypothetical protein